jgi:hypothetical protein
VDRATFTELIRQNGEPADVVVLGRIFAWASEHELKDTWESGSAHGDGWAPVMKHVEWEPVPFGIGTTPPRLFVSGENLRRHHPFRADQRWQSVLDQLYEIPAVVRTEQGYFPHIRLRDLEPEATWSAFTSVVEAMLAEVRRSSERGIR